MEILNKLTLSTLVLAASFIVQVETRAVIGTNMSNIGLSLDETKAPEIVANFASYARKGFYDNTVFHRVIDGFMIQDGGFTPDMIQRATNKTISNEADNGLKNTVGIIAMVRTGSPSSTTSQFFTNATDNESLSFKSKTAQGYGYTIFGKAISGMEVVEKVVKVQTTDRGYHQNVPVKSVIIRKVIIDQ